MTVIDLMAKRKPVHYSVHVSHGWDGKMTIQVEGVGDDRRSRLSVAWAMLKAAEMISGLNLDEDGRAEALFESAEHEPPAVE